jgi:exodeoxyribonuclease VII large subunit
VSQPAFDFGDAELDDAGNPTYGVAELAEAINEQLHRGFTDGVWVRGEIDGLSNRGPHTYFSLVEQTDEGKAVLNVQLFAPMKRRLTPILKRNRLELRNGMKVRIFGHLDFWAQGGRLGLKMAGLDPRYTLGEIAQSRDEVMRRLAVSGLLDANRRVPFPALPLRVGVATSLDSAAWHDFRDELVRSGHAFHLTVADTRVQGEYAVPMVAGAVGTLARLDLDVIVVIRGGGARNELAVFDAEPIARTIATAPVPVLTGLGHEIDRSVADEVAHLALKTPTACAGELVNRVAAFLGAAEERWVAIQRRADGILVEALGELSDRAHRVARRTHAAVERSDERLAARAARLRHRAPSILADADARLVDRQRRLLDRSDLVLERQAQRLERSRLRLSAVDPGVQLARGWSITRDSDGRLVRSISDTAPGDELVTIVADGTVTSTVTDSTASPPAPAPAPETGSTR